MATFTQALPFLMVTLLVVAALWLLYVLVMREAPPQQPPAPRDGAGDSSRATKTATAAYVR